MPANLIPAEWLSKCEMQGIVVHWTAGQHKASSDDRTHYHVLIEDDGKLIRGTHTIADNVDTLDGVYAAHTLHHNTGIIGVSMCGMLDAVESPFSPGPQPLTPKQWEVLPQVLAQLCLFYRIQPLRTRVLCHGEVQDVLGITQRGKWDVGRLVFLPDLKGCHAVGNAFRAATAAILDPKPSPTVA